MPGSQVSRRRRSPPDAQPDGSPVKRQQRAAAIGGVSARLKRVELLRHVASGRTARSHVRNFCAEMPTFVSATAELLASELVANAVVHGEGVIELPLSVHGEVLRIEVSDEAPAQPQLQQPTSLETDGRGLQFVDAYALAWGTSRNDAGAGKTVWCELRV